MLASLSQKRMDSIKASIGSWSDINKPNQASRRLSSFMELLQATHFFNLQALVRARKMNQIKERVLFIRDRERKLSAEVMNLTRQELHWWRKTIQLPMQANLNFINPLITIITDASPFGYGAEIRHQNQKLEIHGEQDLPIILSQNKRELKAVFKTQQITFKRKILAQNQDVNLISPSTTVVAIPNKHTITLSLLKILIPIMQNLEKNKCRIRSNHISGVDNIRAEELSRFKDSSILQLQPELFKEICLEFRIIPEVDFFASIKNQQITSIFSRILEVKSERVDAMMQDWSQYKIVYSFSPPIVIMEVSYKIKRDKVTALMILPQWSAQISISVLQSMKITHRRSLSCFQLISIIGLAVKLSGNQIFQGQVKAIVVAPENPKQSQY
ncbi:MAG: hypothetical protein EZS28_035430 [Streblomastix strix]|uniref:Uncharacterized protein n=1 Tax=Streblomastix strix TaxID=222440 RepID=A0A5J4UFT6_9EUKA|nr:MAG: hypothetical protein EZS28_035430 [Streblomastix strix]